jgi:hypothetical protein
MGRRERLVDPAAGPLQAFAHQLRELRRAAGSPSYRELARRAHFSDTSLSVAASGASLPSLEVTLGYVRACGGDIAEWEQRWRQVARQHGPGSPDSFPAGDPATGGTAAGDPGSTALTATPGLRYSLPPDTAAFTGRCEELAAITAQVTGAAQPGGVVPIHAIGGMPGVGKTALAVHAAHQLRDLFPDRQLFIDLHAHTPGHDPVPPGMALAGLLTAIGADARNLPDDTQARASLWRDRMAGQRALLVLDNAAHRRPGTTRPARRQLTPRLSTDTFRA